MKNKGCAFELKGNGKSRYYSAPEVSGLADFARFLYENRAGAAGTPLPLGERIPQAEEISETAWQKIADHKAADCACYFMLDIRENQVWVNEDTGAGMGLYLFPFTAVMEEAAFGTSDIWERLLARFPHARMDGA